MVVRSDQGSCHTIELSPPHGVDSTFAFSGCPKMKRAFVDYEISKRDLCEDFKQTLLANESVRIHVIGD